MREWWESLQARDRMYLIAGAAAVVLMLFYSFIINPLYSNAGKLQRKIPAQQSELRWMQQAVVQIKQLEQSRPRNTRNRSMLSVIDERVTATGLKSAVQRMEPEGRDTVKIWLKSGAFDQFLLMLGMMEQEDGIAVSSFSLTPTDKIGEVDARATLTRGGS